MKKNVNTVKRTIKKIKATEEPIPPWRRDNMEFYMSPLGKATIPSMERIADELLDFVLKNETLLHLEEFYLRKGLTYDTFHGWLEKSKYLKERYKAAMQILGLRRKKILSKSNPNTLTHTLYQHSPDWDKADKRNSDLKSKENKNADADQLIQELKLRGILKAMPDTDVVKKQTKDKE